MTMEHSLVALFFQTVNKVPKNQSRRSKLGRSQFIVKKWRLNFNEGGIRRPARSLKKSKVNFKKWSQRNRVRVLSDVLLCVQAPALVFLV